MFVIALISFLAFLVYFIGMVALHFVPTSPTPYPHRA